MIKTNGHLNWRPSPNAPSRMLRYRNRADNSRCSSGLVVQDDILRTGFGRSRRRGNFSKRRHRVDEIPSLSERLHILGVTTVGDAHMEEENVVSPRSLSRIIDLDLTL